MDIDSDKRMIYRSTKDGCCWHQPQGFPVVRGIPKKVYEKTEDVRNEKKPDTVTITTRRVVNGKWRKTSNTQRSINLLQRMIPSPRGVFGDQWRSTSSPPPIGAFRARAAFHNSSMTMIMDNVPMTPRRKPGVQKKKKPPLPRTISGKFFPCI